MADHIRTQIRNQAVAMLTSAQIAISGKVAPVKKTQVLPKDMRELPVIIVYTPVDTITPAVGSHRGKRIVKRSVMLDVVACMTAPPGDAGFDDDLDSASAQIESAFGIDPTMRAGGQALVTDLKALSTETGFYPLGSSLVAIARLRFSVTVNSLEGDPTSTLTRA